MTDVQLAVPPNIARGAMEALKSRFPGISIRPRQTHAEMDSFFLHDFGKPEHTADLTLTAYPAALASLAAMEVPEEVFNPMPDTLPPLRSELAAFGLTEINPYYRVGCMVCFVPIVHKDVRPFPESWADLCREDIRDAVVLPPEVTPAPALYSYFQNKLNGEKGREAALRATKRLLPQEINLAVDAGDFKAGVLLSAFGRAFRYKNASMVWPREGALSLPLLVFVKKDAPEETFDVLETIFSQPFQEFLARDGGFISIRSDVDFFGEVAENHCHIQWMGWQDYITK